MPPPYMFVGPLVVLLGVLALAYALAPIGIRSRQKMRRLSPSKALDFQDCTPEVGLYLQGMAAVLQEHGFQVEAFLVSDPASASTTYLALLTNRTARDKAMVAVITSRNGNITNTTSYVELTTTYENGWHFDTLNATTLGAFRVRPQTVRTQVPDLEDPHRLYELHRYLLAKHPIDGPKTIYPEGTAEEYLSSVMVRAYEEQVQTGWMYLDPREDVYRLTWKGAYLITWGLLFPVKSLRTWRMRAKGRAVMRDFDKSASQA